MVYAKSYNKTIKFVFEFKVTAAGVFDKMCPSIEPFDNMIAYKKFKYDSLKRFDVVVVSVDEYDNFFKVNREIKQYLRIIGLPNEKIEIKDNKIYINDKLTDDKYAFYGSKLKPIKHDMKVSLDNNSYFVMGDNRYSQRREWTREENKNTYNDISQKNAYIVPKNKITGKLIAINYADNLYLNKNTSEQPRNKTGVMLLNNDKTLEHNPSGYTGFVLGKNIKK